MYLLNSAGNLATLSIRGSNANQTQLFWNGIPVNSATLGLSDMSLFPVDFINTISIMKGGASLSNGSGGIGGAVCLFSSPTLQKGILFTMQFSIP